MNVLELSEQEIGRRQSLQELRDMGIDPYPAAEYPTNAFSTDIKENFVDEGEPREVCIAGRMMSRRVMGKASFAELQDSKGRIQVYITRDDICPGEDKDLYNKVFKRLLDIGDFIGVRGFVFRTQTGEISVHARELTLLSKSLKPLPIVKYKDGVAYDKFDDPELRYRQRYVDLVVNDGVKDTFLQRATVIRTIRRVLDEAGYTEVETPTLQSIAGGASARPFITHFNALDCDMYMRIATELYLKRLIVGGFEGVYEIGKNFRNEGMDRNHNPEFTCMELYVQYKDYNWMMSFTEKLLETVCIAVNGKPEREIDGRVISFKAPYRRLPILDAIKEKTGYDLTGMDEAQIREVCGKLGMEIGEKPTLGPWRNFLERRKNATEEVHIGLVGKYDLQDAYKSIRESLSQAGTYNDHKTVLTFINSEKITEDNVAEKLAGQDGIVICPGFGQRGIEGKIVAAHYTRTHNIPTFGICLGMQMMVIEFARNVLGYADANSREMDEKTEHNVIDIMEEQKDITNLGGTMRLGAYECVLKQGSRVLDIYKQEHIQERHRHRYEFNSTYQAEYERHGMMCTGRNPESGLIEIVEIPGLKWYIGTQFHPEYQSTVLKPHPLFLDFVRTAIDNKK